MKRFLKYLVITIASLVALSYILGYDYLWSGITKTYLRGETSPTIDDGQLFPSHTILTTKPKLWQKDSLYNKHQIPILLSKKLQQTNTAAFVVVKNGKLLYEEYWGNYNAQSRTNSFSMAKTITALLLGAAIDDGKIKNENQSLSDFYPNYANTKYGNKVTLKHLVTMESGLNWDEKSRNPFSSNAKAYYGNNLGKTVLLKGFREMPGQKFEYQSGTSQLLGFVIRKAINQPLADYASSKLWIPLGMEFNAEWNTDNYGMEKTFCCIQSNARDYAKLGQFLLNDGKVDSLQIISKSYLDRMRTPTKESNYTYGYSIWINRNFKYPYYYFRALLGQYIIIIPEKKLVIVRTGNYKNIEKTSNGHPKLVEFIIEQIAGHF